MKTTSNKEFDWKTIGQEEYIYSVRTGLILGSVYPYQTYVDGCIFTAKYGSESLGDYISAGYAKAAVLEAASLAVTKKTTKRA